MKGGVDLQKYVDLLVPGPSKIKIIHGEGPVHLVGSHCVDFFGFKDDEESDDEEGEKDPNKDEFGRDIETKKKLKRKNSRSPDRNRLI